MDMSDFICAGFGSFFVPKKSMSQINEETAHNPADRQERSQWALKQLSRIRERLARCLPDERYAPWAARFDELSGGKDLTEVYPTFAAAELEAMRGYALSDRCREALTVMAQVLRDQRVSVDNLREVGKMALHTTKVPWDYAADASNNPSHGERQEVNAAKAAYKATSSEELCGCVAEIARLEAAEQAWSVYLKNRLAIGTQRGYVFDSQEIMEASRVEAYERLAAALLALIEAAPSLA